MSLINRRIIAYRFKNRPKMTFDDAHAEADQTFELHRDHTGRLEYTTK